MPSRVASRWIGVLGFGVLAVGSWLTGLMGANAEEASAKLPRYKLRLGQELVYKGNSTFKYERGKLLHNQSLRVWVVRENPDGSWHLILRQGSSTDQVRDEEESRPADAKPDEEVQVAWCDLHPDGRFDDNDSFGSRMRPAGWLPRLPPDAASAAKSWQTRNANLDETITYRMESDALENACQIAFVRESAMDAIYGVENKGEIKFDLERGVPTELTDKTRQTYGFNGEGTGKSDLVEVAEHTPEWCAQFCQETEKYFAATKAVEKAARQNDLEPDEYRKALERAAEELSSLAKELQSEELKALVEEQLPRQKQLIDYYVEESVERKALLGKPSDEWATTDFEGRDHALKDYRGKVVVLDFWYRGCGWCIRAMPQMKEIAEELKDRPVAVFGMNTDRKDEDAQFVIEKMGLNYTNLKATGIPEKYKVTGFPTLIILDQEGIIRDIHVGYSPTLRENVVKSVRKLLGGE